MNRYLLAIAVLCAAGLQAVPPVKNITATDCTVAKLGTMIEAAAIGEPVSAVVLSAPVWHAATDKVPAYCGVEGQIAPIDKSAPAIRFAVALPAEWAQRAAQMGGSGFNGFIPWLTGGASWGAPPLLALGFATYGSDSGHQTTFPPRRDDRDADRWTLNDEAMRNIGYMQLKKTHDAAFVLIERLYGARPSHSYFIGASQGGREALTVAQRYPADYDGIAAEVPIVSFSTLMLAPELIRIAEKPLAHWVTPVKVNAIRAEMLRQCDKLDGLVDGVINNYVACRAIFNVQQGSPHRHPWAAKRCPDNVDPNPQDNSSAACLTDGQIGTLELTYSNYTFASPLANGVKSFGMWLPNTDPSGGGIIAATRFRAQEGASADAPVHGHMGVAGVTGFLMRDLAANPLDYVEGGPLDARRVELSWILDSTNPDLGAYARHGGKLIVVIGTNDTIASPGAQLDYYQSVLDRMGREAVDAFARFYVLPQTDHGLNGKSADHDGDGRAVAVQPIPNRYDRLELIVNWVERGQVPGRSVNVTAGQRSLPMCSYPDYPRYTAGPASIASSYVCASR